ncbi:diacylglycerol kinase [Fistulifera solaris]|uniref:Diacylglycerol kinase n=1 Tax=Fistulifera solaris TaxID=1519565 RepID=A0A1Z5J869_FISSO|nr:diacylglycerol kinase [Fistulifera solaris]|eukprot:GAX10008.1 diacylglycerol kinase [Fistulifera solaris]
MSSFVDNFEYRTEEEIYADEELIEAVEHLVETAAQTVWSGIVEDIQTLRMQLHRIMQFLFPIVFEYWEDPSRMERDLLCLALYLSLVMVAVFVLAPRRSKEEDSRSLVAVKSSSSMHSSLTGTASRRDNFSPAIFPDRLFHYQDSVHNSDSESKLSDIRVDEITLTDEERFEQAWENKIAQSDYHRLVLPPSCRRVLAAQLRPTKNVVTNGDDKQKSPPSSDDDDNPARRIQTYIRYVLWFLRSIISFDYAHAGWTLICWLQGIRRHRQSSNEPVRQGEERQIEDLEDDEDDNTHEIPSSTRPEVPRTLSDSVLVEAEEEKKEEGFLSSPIGEKDDCVALKEDEIEGPSNLPEEHVIAELKSPGDGLKTTSDADLVLSRDSVGRLRKGTVSSATSVTADDDETGCPATPERKYQLQSPAASPTNCFFETANSQDSLDKLMVEVALPDKNGYILADEMLPESRCTPLLVFVNSRSGPQQGHLLITQLRRLLNPIQVWDLADGSPDVVLESFCVLTRLRILVCGGDGTVSWIIGTLEKMKLKRKWPPIAILPLGTGNDLARFHGWGGGYNNESLLGILNQISESYISMLDRWEVSITGTKKKKVSEVKNFTNYLGVGADAQAALQVHYLRETRPDWFFSRILNKAWYGVFGAEDIIKASSLNIRKEIRLIADGVEIPIPHDSQGIILLNIDSYAGGVPLWSTGTKIEDRSTRSRLVQRRMPKRSMSLIEFSRPLLKRTNSFESIDDTQLSITDEERVERVTACDRPSSCQDGLLEIVSIRGAFHLGQIKVGLGNAQRLCQCREATIMIKKKVAVQVDGEPWKQPQCILKIRRIKESAAMLHRSVDDGGVETEMSQLLDWAEERHLIDGQVHSILLKEFSRRIESKTRQRRHRPTKDYFMSTLKRAIATKSNSNLQSAHESAVIF